MMQECGIACRNAMDDAALNGAVIGANGVEVVDMSEGHRTANSAVNRQPIGYAGAMFMAEPCRMSIPARIDGSIASV
jgi:hypothetical protein